MSVTFNMYPVLTEKHIENIGYISELLEFSYTENYNDNVLMLENITGAETNFSAELRDPKCAWYPENNNLILHKCISFKSTKVLFGNKGVAPSSAILGIAERWISTKSSQRGIIPFAEVRQDDCTSKFSFDYKFDKNILKGSLILQTIIYLKKADNIAADEVHLAHQSGTVLGVLDSCEIFIDGNGSVFPISTVSIPGKPLWWVDYDYTADPLVDAFNDEYVEIKLNRAHASYDSLKINSNLKESTLFLEIISAALLIIIESVKEVTGPDWKSILSGEGFQRGSIAEAVYYFTNKLGWDANDPTKLAYSIHKFFDDNLKGEII